MSSRSQLAVRPADFDAPARGRRHVGMDPGARRARRHRRARLVGAVAVLDVAVVAIAAATMGSQLLESFLLGTLSAVIFGAMGLHRIETLVSRSRQLERLSAVVVLVGLGAFLGASLRGGPMDAGVAATLVGAALATAASRMVVTGLSCSIVRRSAVRVLVVGSDRRARELAERHFAEGRIHERIVGFRPLELPEGPIDALTAGERDVVAACAAGDVDRVLISCEGARRGELVGRMLRVVSAGAEVTALSSRFGALVGRARAASLDGVPLLRLAPTPLRGVRALLKRAIDVAGALLGIVVLSPLFFAIAAAIKLTSPGPVLFTQRRVGKGGRTFLFYKFRSMRKDAPTTTHRDYVQSWIKGQTAAEGEGQTVYKMTDDPRVTGVGRFIRRTSLDELPQLFNVLRGEMSLVGPRPCMPYEYELYEPWQTRRFDVTPGCTGLWQVTARSSVDFEDMVLLDLHYISNWSLIGDLRLIAKTVPVMVFGEGGF